MIRGLFPERAATTGLKLTEAPERAENFFFFRGHASAVSGNQPLVEKPVAGQVFRGKHSVAVLDHFYFAPILIQVDGGDDVEFFLQGAQRLQERRRDHVRSMGGDCDGDAAVFRAVPFGVKIGNPPQSLVGEFRVGLEDARLADADSFGAVRYLLGQDQTEPRRDDGFSVILDVVGDIHRSRGAAAQSLEHGEAGHGRALFGV